MSCERRYKDPDAIIDFSLDWTTWLAGDTIATSTYTVQTGITKDSDTNTDQVTTVWLSGGTAKESYLITNRITTTGGRTQDQSFYVVVQEN